MVLDHILLSVKLYFYTLRKERKLKLEILIKNDVKAKEMEKENINVTADEQIQNILHEKLASKK